MVTALDQARESYAAQRWRDAFETLSAPDPATLDLDDLERLAISAYLVGEDDASADAWTRAHQEALRADDPARAARCAFWHACGLLFRGAMAPAMGWIARGKRVLDESGVDCVEEGWYLTLTNLPVMFRGDVASAYPNFVRAVEIARRFDDPTSMSLGLVALGQCEIDQGRIADGIALLDEAMVSVASGEVAPIFVGIAYCAVVSTCQSLFDLRRAREWTAALTRWCDAQQGLVPFRGNCLVHRCEIFQLQGAWPDALDAAQAACDVLAGPPEWDSLGLAFYQLGEVHRVRGDLKAAEEAFKRASRSGNDPQPGMSLVHLARGRTDDAVAAIRRALDEPGEASRRMRLLPAAVEILLAAGQAGAARACADELDVLAGNMGAPLLRAIAGHAAGMVLLAEGHARDALTRLREACDLWRSLDVPYDAARTRAAIAEACRAVGDTATAELELESARSAFELLGAVPDAVRAGARRARGTSGLTDREVEVLRLVAAGKTNRAVAADLVLSEKTVARHVANIFTKLGVSSRSAATAWAYENGLV
jgi:DNA-binding NarL/FixJ family response regulator